MKDHEKVAEAFEKVCERFSAYMRETRANTQPQKLYELELLGINYSYNSDDNVIREGLIEHVGFLPVLATTLFPYINDDSVDLGQALIMLAIHDIGETVTGDKITFLKSSKESEEEQKIALSLLNPIYHDDYDAIENPSSSTSRFAKSMDKTVADFIDYLCPSNITMQRYKVQLELTTAEQIVNMKLKHKARHFEWNPFLKELFAYTLAQTKTKLS